MFNFYKMHENKKCSGRDTAAARTDSPRNRPDLYPVNTSIERILKLVFNVYFKEDVYDLASNLTISLAFNFLIESVTRKKKKPKARRLRLKSIRHAKTLQIVSYKTPDQKGI